MVCPTNKIDSNITGLRYAEEECYNQLPETGIVFYPLEPDSYADFGGENTLEPRNPINPSRQNQKGTIVDLDANAGLTQDLTMALPRLWQGFCFADAREKADTQPLNGTAVTITNVDGTTNEFDAAAGLDAFAPGELIFTTGFSEPANNGLFVVDTAAAAALGVTGSLEDETPPANARVQTVGFEFASGDLSIDVSGSLPRLVSATVTMTDLGLIPGEWIYIGGDAASTFFPAPNGGWARINSVGSTYLELDKTDDTFTTQAGTGLTVRIFYGRVIRNENDPALIKRRSYTFERTLGTEGGDVQGEYVHGCVANSMTLNITTASKVTVDMAFVGADTSYYKGTGERITASRPDNPGYHTFNSASNFSRLRLMAIDPATSNPARAANFFSDMTLTIDNGVTPNKAITFLGSFDATAANFVVGGSMEAYFTDVATIQLVKDNADVTLDFAIAAQNKGFVFDVPLLALGNGRANVEKDQPIKLPLENNAAEGKFGNTLTICVFDYLPTKAQ